MADMFGAPVGWSQAGRDSDARLMNALSAAKGVGELDMQPAQKSLMESNARLHGAQADKVLSELATQRRVDARMAEGGPAGNEDPADMLERLGRIQFDAGAWEAGTKSLKEAETYRLRDARELDAKESAAYKQLQTQAQAIETWGAATSAVGDQAGLDRFRLQMAERAATIKHPAIRAQIMGMLNTIPADYAAAKPVLQQYTDQAIKAVDKVRIEQRTRDQERKDEFLSLREKVVDAQETAREVRADAAEQRRLANVKVGGAPQQDVTTAGAWLTQQFGGKAPEGVMVGAAELAETARNLMRTNPALTYTQALAQSFDPAAWEEEKNWGPNTIKYRAAGQSAGRPKPLPASKNPKDLKAGEWYGDGTAAQKWTGSAWSDK